MRSGSALVGMSEDRLREIFAEGAPDWLEEPSITELDAQKIVDLLDTQSFFELLKLPYPTNRDGVIERLKDEQLIGSVNGAYSIRRLGGIGAGKTAFGLSRPGTESSKSGCLFRNLQVGDNARPIW